MPRPPCLSTALAAALLGAFGAASALAQSAAAPAASAPVLREGQRIDDRRPDKPLTVDLLGRPVQLTGSWEYSDERRRNFDLDSTRNRDRRVRDHEVKLEARTRPNADTEVFVQAVGLHTTRRTESTAGVQVRRTKSLERGQTWVKFDQLGGGPWSLQLGRVALIDRRAWWWDDDLDAMRVQFEHKDWRLDTGLSKQLGRVSSADDGITPESKGVQRWFGQGTWKFASRQNLDVFWLLAKDRSGRLSPGTTVAADDVTDPSDLNARWLGARVSGEWRRPSGYRLAYWADAAMLRGRETDFAEPSTDAVVGGRTRRVRGQALDVGATAHMPYPMRPSVTLGYARGSGGERSARLDANFRQTGLQENKARLGGVKRWRMYGELLQPELSNLAVTKLGGGLRFLDNSSVEMVVYGYRQPVPSVVLAGSRLGSSPLGRSGDIGREIDLLIALREWKHLEFTLSLARFMPGSAFADNRRDPAYSVELGAALNF